jgi:two-component system, OmpR family, sensor histidine kinase ChvG
MHPKLERRRLLIAAVVGLFVVLLAGSAILIRHLEEARREAAAEEQAATESRARVAALATTTMLESSTGSIPDDIVRAQRLMSRLATSGDLQGIQLGLYFVPRGKPDQQPGLLVASSATREFERPFGALSERSGLDVAELLKSTCRADPPLTRPARWSYATEGHVLSLLPLVTASGCWGVVTLRPAATMAPVAAGFAPSANISNPAAALGIALVLLAIAFLLYQFRHVLWGIGDLARAQPAAAPRAGAAPYPAIAGQWHRFAGAPTTAPALPARQRTAAVGLDREALEELAHGLKTPVATIIQSLEPLRRNLPDEDPSSRRSLQIIETASRRLIDLIQALPGRAAGKPDNSDDGRLAGIVDIVHSAVTGLDVPNNDVRLRIVDMTHANALLAGDGALLRAAVEHIVENAIDFSPAGGEVCVRITAGHSLAVLAIEDEGPGVSPQSLPKIFNRYFSDRTLRSPAGEVVAPANDTPNFGLGLWIARRNVEALHGRIFAENRRNGGLRVTISLPIAQLADR